MADSLVTSDYQTIQNALVIRAKEGVFPSLTMTSDLTCVLGPAVQPVSVVAMEVESEFGPPIRDRMHPHISERLSWTWELHLEFARDVSFEQFELELTQDPIKLMTDGASPRFIRLDLKKAIPAHAIASGGPSGCIYTFSVFLSPELGARR